MQTLQVISCSHPVILQIVLLKSTADKLKHLKVAVFVQQWKVSREMEMAFASTILQEMMQQRKRSVICSAITPHN